MFYKAQRPIGLADRMLAVGECVAAEELGDSVGRLLELDALAAVPNEGDLEPALRAKARKTE